MRDALSALDQVLAFTSDAVSAADVSTVLGLIGRDQQFEVIETVASEDLPAAFALAGTVVESGFDLRIVCRELARLVRDLLVIKIDPTRIADPEIAAETERDRLTALAERFSREDLMRAFDLLGRTEFEIKSSSQPRHHFELALVKWIHLRQLTPLTDLIARFESGAPAPARPPAPAPRPPSPQASRPSGTQASTLSSTQASKPSGPQAPKPSGPESSRPPSPQASKPSGPQADLKTTVLASIRESNKVFYGMVVAQAQKVDVEGDALVFTFAPVHQQLRGEFEKKRAWIEQLAHAASGRKIAVTAREGVAAAAAPTPGEDAGKNRRADLRARAKAEPTVQAVLDVFGGEIEDVEET
jgi:DNA polymerase-3 subunit gamma/tau